MPTLVSASGENEEQGLWAGIGTETWLDGNIKELDEMWTINEGSLPKRK